MSQKSFNKMMEDYLQQKSVPVSKKKSKNSFKKQKREFDDNPELLSNIESNKVHIVKGESSFFDRLFQKVISMIAVKEQETATSEKKNTSTDEETVEIVNSMEFDREEKELSFESRETVFDRLRSFFSSLFSSSEPERFVEDDSKEELTEEAEEIIEEEKEILDKEKELEIKKENFIVRFFKRFRFSKEEVEDIEGEVFSDESVNDDLKEIAKITTSLMKIVPPKRFEEFKESDEFKKFMEILDRNNLIKK